MKKCIGLALLCVVLNSLPSTAFCGQVTSSWSVVYKKVYTQEEQRLNKQKKQLIFTKTQTVPFTQLLLSWNVFRSREGQFVFFMRVHTQGTEPGHWQPWHKVALWGDGVQKSYFDKGSDSSFEYVRLEMKDGLFGDGFEVKVVPTDSSLDDVQALFVCASNYKEFKPERPWLVGKDLPSVKVSHVAKKSQKMVDHPRVGALCSPTTVSMMLEGILDEPIDSLETARGVYDESLDIFGNWSCNMAYAFEKSNGAYFFYTSRLPEFARLHSLLLKGVPVGVSVRGRIKGARKVYPNGHLLVVIGFDKEHQKVLCYDPAFDTLDQVEVAYDLAEFLPAWERSYRLAYRIGSRS